MGQFLTLIAALWTLVLSAPLCVSGVVAHPCETCVEVCSHEAACPQDPCSLKVSQNDTSKTLSSYVHLDATSLLPTWLTPVALAFSLQEKALTDATLFPSQ